MRSEDQSNIEERYTQWVEVGISEAERQYFGRLPENAYGWEDILRPRIGVAFPEKKTRSDVTFLDGVFHEVGGILQIQFLHDIGTMMFDGTDADKQQIPNLLTRFSLCDQL